jgi:hypothetical protein
MEFSTRNVGDKKEKSKCGNAYVVMSKNISEEKNKYRGILYLALLLQTLVAILIVLRQI